MSALPKLVVGKPFDRPDYELAFAEEFQTILQATTGKSEQDAVQTIVAKAHFNADAHNDTMNGLLYGILTSPQTQSAMLLKVALAATRDKMAFFLSGFRRLVLEKWTKFIPDAHERSLFIAHTLTKDAATACAPDALDGVFIALLRQIAVGNVSTANTWLASSIVDVFNANLDWLRSRDSLVPFVVYTYLSVLNDHVRPDLHALRDKEATLCALLIREQFDSVKVIGRDLVRLLHGSAALPELENVFRTVLGAQMAASPPADFDAAALGADAQAPISNLRMLLNTRTPKQFFECRLTPEMENWLMWIMQNVRMGNQNRYQKWFSARFLATPESENLIPELIRFICGFFHPSNALISSDIIPRWAVIGWLLYLARSAHAAANVRLALVYDWLFFNSKDSIMNIEPGLLVMINSLPKYADMTNTLLEFLFLMADNYIAPGSNSAAGLKADTRRGVQHAFTSLISRGVVHPQQFKEALLTSSLIDPRVRDNIIRTTAALYPDLQPQTSKPATPAAPQNAAIAPTESKPSSAVHPPANGSSKPPAKQTLLPTVPAPAEAPKTKEEPLASPVSTLAATQAVEQKPVVPVTAPKHQNPKPPQPKPLPAAAKTFAPTPQPTTSSEEEADVLMNWASAVKSTPLNTSAELELPSALDSDRAAKRKGPDTPSNDEPPAKKLKKDDPSPSPLSGSTSAAPSQAPTPLSTSREISSDVNLSTVKPVLDNLQAALSSSSPINFANALKKLLSSGLFEAESNKTRGSNSSSPTAVARGEVAKQIVEMMAEELQSNDPKQWILSPEGLPASKLPPTPFLYHLFGLFFDKDDVIVSNVTRLVECLREIEISVGWRLLTFCVQRANLVTVQLFSKTTKKKGSGGSARASTSQDSVDEAVAVREKEWFQAQLAKLQRLDQEEEKKAPETIFWPYEMLLKQITGKETERPALLCADARSCAEASVPIFLELVPALVRFLSIYAAEETEFVKLLCHCATPAQLTSICHRVSVGEIPMIGTCFQRVIKESLDWPSVAQYCLWQLVQSEFFDQLETLETSIPDILEDIDPTVHPEAIIGIQRILQELKPTKDLLDCLLKLPARFGPFCTVSIVFWNSKSITTFNSGGLIPKENRDAIKEYDYPAILRTSITGVLKSACASKKNNRSFMAQRALRHLTLVFLAMNKQTRSEFFAASFKSEILKVVKQFSLEKEFAELVSFCEGATTNAPAAKKNSSKKSAAKPKKASAAADETNSNSSHSSTKAVKKRKRNEDDEDDDSVKKEGNKKRKKGNADSDEEVDVEQSSQQSSQQSQAAETKSSNRKKAAVPKKPVTAKRKARVKQDSDDEHSPQAESASSESEEMDVDEGSSGESPDEKSESDSKKKPTPKKKTNLKSVKL